MAKLQTLAKDTAIYGLSSIIGRFLNYLLVPLYTVKLAVSGGGYGVVTQVYAMTAFFLILLTYGMETGFFRFVNKDKKNAEKIYSTTLISVGSTSLLFILLCLLFLTPISSALGYSQHPEFIGIMAVVVALDAFQCIPFAYLRYKKRPIKFAAIKLLFIVSNITLNLFFLVLCPWLHQSHSSLVSWFYNPDYLVGYIFIANIICTSLQMLAFIPELRVKYVFDYQLWKKMLSYSFPLLILGITGILYQTVDKILYPFLLENKADARVQLGIYGAASKIAMIMAMFLQAFRYAYEPFVFGERTKNEEKNKKMYAQAMKFFIVFSFLAFLSVMFYLDIIKYIISPDYWSGLRVVPIVMMSAIFMGIYFNLSFWYKLIDETWWGALFSIIGCSVIILLNVLFVPKFGYMASAWAGFIGYLISTNLSYFIGQKKYKIDYNLKSIAGYTLLAGLLFAAGQYIVIDNLIFRLIFRTILLFIFVLYIVKKDLPLSQIPFVKRFIK